MNKEETIAKYGEVAWEKHLAQRRAYYKEHKEQDNARSEKYKEEHPEERKEYIKNYQEEHPEEVKARNKKYKEEHPEVVIANHQEEYRKGGKHYDKKLEYQTTGIPGAKQRIRGKHQKQYKPYKDIIAPDSQIHHEWIPDTSEYRGIALVETDQHMHGFVDVIEILAGEITLRTEEEIRKGKKKNEK